MLEKLKADRIVAMKLKDVVAKNILTYLLSEIQGIAKTEQREVTDNDVEDMAKSLIKKNENLIELQGDSTQLKRENAILTGFAPKKYTEATQSAIINLMYNALPDSEKGNIAIQKLMPQLKQHGELIDKRTASMYIKNKGSEFEAKLAKSKDKVEPKPKAKAKPKAD